MDKNKLVKKVKEIEMSKDMQQRIIENCYAEMEGKNMNITKKIFKKPMAVAASFVLCLCLAGVTSLAATGKLQGFFKDITRWDGAVIGTSYEQATDEINLSVTLVSNELTVNAEMVNPNIAPYNVFQSLGINNYKILDSDGNTVVEDAATEVTEIVEGKATFVIPVSDIASGNYTLVVNEFVGSAKAEQPLVLHGTWECKFTR